MTTTWGKNISYECVVCVCLTFATIFLPIAFFLASGFLMGVMTISFTLPIDLYNYRWNGIESLFKKILFWKILNYYPKYHNRL